MAIPLMLRLGTPAGEFDGVLATVARPERLVRLLRAIRVGERSVIGIMNREGRLYVWSTSIDPLPAGVTAVGVPRSATTVIGDEKRTLATWSTWRPWSRYRKSPVPTCWRSPRSPRNSCWPSRAATDAASSASPC